MDTWVLFSLINIFLSMNGLLMAIMEISRISFPHLNSGSNTGQPLMVIGGQIPHLPIQ